MGQAGIYAPMGTGWSLSSGRLARTPWAGVTRVGGAVISYVALPARGRLGSGHLTRLGFTGRDAEIEADAIVPPFAAIVDRVG